MPAEEKFSGLVKLTEWGDGPCCWPAVMVGERFMAGYIQELFKPYEGKNIEVTIKEI